MCLTTLLLCAFTQERVLGCVMVLGVELPQAVVSECLRADSLKSATELVARRGGTVKLDDGYLVCEIGDPGHKDQSRSKATLLERLASKGSTVLDGVKLEDLGVQSLEAVVQICGGTPLPQFNSYAQVGEIACVAAPSMLMTLEVNGEEHVIPVEMMNVLPHLRKAMNSSPSRKRTEEVKEATDTVTYGNEVRIRYSWRGDTSEKLAVASRAVKAIADHVAASRARFNAAFEKFSQALGLKTAQEGTSYGQLPPAMQERVRRAIAATGKLKGLTENEVHAALQKAKVAGTLPTYTLCFTFDWATPDGGRGVNMVIAP